MFDYIYIYKWLHPQLLVSIHILPQSNSLAVSPSQHGCFNTKLWSSNHDLDVGHGSPKKTPITSMTSVSPSDVFFSWDFRYLNLPSPKIMRKIQRLEVFPRAKKPSHHAARQVLVQNSPVYHLSDVSIRPLGATSKTPSAAVPEVPADARGPKPGRRWL